MSIAFDIELPGLHANQRRVADSPARFQVMACGRRWGKTRLGALMCVVVALRGLRAWWVAPTYRTANVGWRQLKRLVQPIPGRDQNETIRQIALPGGGTVEVRSADDPDSLRGEGLDYVVMDECAFIKEPAWSEALRPALSDRQGRAMFISTPKGQNWFWRLWLRGQDGGEWASWRFPTSDNPFIEPSEIEAARQLLPDLTFRQEYLAEFLEGEGVVFRNIDANLTAAATTPEAHRGHKIVAGVDWGKQADCTAISVVCADCKAEVAHDRFNQIDYHVQYQRLESLCDRWGVAQVMAESNAMGEPNIEALQRAGLPVVPFQTTASTKPPLIESLALAFEQQECAWLPDPVWKSELEAYEMTINQYTNRPRYGAPAGLHDDTVIARALAWHLVARPTAKVTWTEALF